MMFRVTALPVGRPARVTGLAQLDTAPTARLMTLGILPGLEITVVQRSPAYIVRMGNSTFAMDEELAGRILGNDLSASGTPQPGD